MSNDAQVLARLVELGITLPADPPKPAGLYEPYRLYNGIGFLAAQVPGYTPELLGRIGAELSSDEGVAAARLAAVNALARIQQALGGFDRFVGLLHVAGHVASAPDFHDQPLILDGASQLFLDVLGERGKHSRTAYAPALPLGVCVELEITFGYRD